MAGKPKEKKSTKRVKFVRRKRRSFLQLDAEASSPRLDAAYELFEASFTLYRSSLSNRGDARKCSIDVVERRRSLDRFVGSVRGIQARKFAINLAADCRNIHEEQSFPANFWSVDRWVRLGGGNRFLSRQYAPELFTCYRYEPLAIACNYARLIRFSPIENWKDYVELNLFTVSCVSSKISMFVLWSSVESLASSGS